MTWAERCARLSARKRRLLAVVVVPAAILALGSAIALPIVTASHAQTEWREEVTRVIAAAKHSAAAEGELEQRIAAATNSELWMRFYESSAAQRAATSLHADVSNLLAQAQISTQSLTPIAAQELPHFTRIGIRCTASMRIDQLQQFVVSAARHPKYLRIERLVVTAPMAQSPEDNPSLAVTLEVFGFERASRQERAEVETTLAQGGMP